MDKLITSYDFHWVEAGCSPGSGRYGLQVDIPNDISPVFPYLNARLAGAQYVPPGHILIWKEDDRAYALRPHEIRIVQLGGIDDHEQAGELARSVVERINAVWGNRKDITPCFTERLRPSVVDILRLLPRTSCKQCGYATCLAFATHLREGRALPEQCPPLSEPGHAGNRERLGTLLNRRL